MHDFIAIRMSRQTYSHLRLTVSGKQIVYHALQPEPSESSSPEAIATLDSEITTLRNDMLPRLESEARTLSKQVQALGASMSLDDLRASLETTRRMKVELENRLGPLRQGTVKPVSERERKEVEENVKMWAKRAAARKKICKEMWPLIWEMKMEEGRKKGEQAEVWEEIGCEGEVPK